MATATSFPPGLFVVGVNHRSGTAALRDQLFVDELALPDLLARLRAAGVGQAIVLSTCDRIEVQAVHPDAAGTAPAVVARALAEQAGVDPASLNGQTYHLAGEDALHHIFAVAASLDSQVLGEPQVFGQVKASHRLSRDQGMTGPELEQVLQAAYGAAKRVRTETPIGERPVSIAAIAVSLARDVHGDLSRCTMLMIGDDDMGGLVVEHMQSAGLGRLLVTAPNERRAEAVARQFDCHLVPYDALADMLPETDIVLAAQASRRYIIDAEMVEAALKRRRRKPLFLIDVAIPGNIAPEVDRVEEAFLYDLEDLEKVALEGRADRQTAADDAHRIIAAEVASYCRGQAERSAVPTLTMLRAHFEAVRSEVLRDAGKDADRATQLLINRLLHDPQTVLRDLAATEGDAEAVAAHRLLRRLFRLADRKGRNES
ncbi:MAG: glutamyl-tRNA reductase [Alphaproteobacteria bacterium]|nr:glutamyl-tRNA reductase [Alphaproteobacteria bacterium]